MRIKKEKPCHRRLSNEESESGHISDELKKKSPADTGLSRKERKEKKNYERWIIKYPLKTEQREETRRSSKAKPEKLCKTTVQALGQLVSFS